MKGKELIKILREHGWILDRIEGSHHIMVKKGKRPVPIPVHGNRDLPKGLVHRILKEAGVK
jgi:predicted RNA binding protein YcfA (HicA-like mRNA interferase family)